MRRAPARADRKSTRLNSSHTEIYTLFLHDALPIFSTAASSVSWSASPATRLSRSKAEASGPNAASARSSRSEEHTSELQSHRDLHSFPTRRSSDLQHRGVVGELVRVTGHSVEQVEGGGVRAECGERPLE